MFDRDVLKLDAAATTAAIEKAIREQVHDRLRRRGAVVGVSGGIDSSVVAALCARALGPERVLALPLPERDSGEAALRLGRALAAAIGVGAQVEDIGPVLAAAGCYERQDEAIRMVFPDYLAGWRFKVVLPTVLDGERLNVSKLTVERPDGGQETRRMPLEAYLQLIAATNFKQRVRTMLLYYHADRLNHAVAGTPNRLEYDQGFFVKQGDGAADFKPIAHLYKSQVYQLAEFLGVPEEIRRRPPTTSTFSLPQTQEEFYFGVPLELMDLCLYGRNHGVPAAEVAAAAAELGWSYVGIADHSRSAFYARGLDADRHLLADLALLPALTGPCAAIGLDTHRAVCQPGQRFATYCDDASGGRYRTCQSDIPCGGRGYGRDDRYRDDGYGRYQYNDDRRYREERWYRDDRYRDRRGWDDNGRYRYDRVPDCTRWDYQHNRPCPPGTINRDCHGDCGRR